jgi:hypothetical protein
VSKPEESERERLARNLNELLQELRVAQAGVQILFAFLLSIAFTEPYARASEFQRYTHLVTILLATGSAALLIAPASWHRVLFRRRRREQIVDIGNGFALAGLALLGAAMTGTVLLVADVVLGGWPATVIAVVTGLVFTVLWFLLPLRSR